MTTVASPPPAAAPNILLLVERLGRTVRDKGDVETMMKLDQIMDHANEPERMKALRAIILALQTKKTGDGGKA